MRHVLAMALVVALLAVVGCATSRPVAGTRYLVESPPDESSFAISRADAVEIARELGLEEGIEPWRVRLISLNATTWRWAVTNTLSPRSGRTFRIDPHTGELDEVWTWEATP